MKAVGAPGNIVTDAIGDDITTANRGCSCRFIADIGANCLDGREGWRCHWGLHLALAARGNTHREAVRTQMVNEAAAKKSGAAKYRNTGMAHDGGDHWRWRRGAWVTPN